MKRVVKAVISVFLLSLIFYFIMSFILTMVLFDGQYAEYRPDGYNVFLKYEDMNNDYSERKIEFLSDGFTLRGRVYSPESPEAVVIMAHRKDSNGESLLGEAMAFCGSGFAALVFDLTGNGESEGTYQGGPVRPMYDVAAAVEFARSDSELSGLPVLLYGQGAGGYGVCAALNKVSGVSGVVSVSAYGNSYDLVLDYGKKLLGGFAYIEYPVAALYNSLLCGSDAALDAVAGINASDTPVMVIHGGDDDLITLGGSALISRSDKFVNPNVSCVTVAGKGHANVMRSQAAADALNEYNHKAYELDTKYSGNTPVYEIEKIIEETDRNVINELDSELIDRVIVFFRECISA